MINEIKQKKSEDAHLTTSSAELPFFSSLEKERENKKKTGIFVIAILILSIFLMAAIASSVALNEATIGVSRLQNEISQLEKQKKEYEWDLEKKNDMVAFEQYAVNELGMLKGNQNPTDDREDIIE